VGGAVVVVPDLGSGFDVTQAVRLPTAMLGLRAGDALGSALGVVQSATGALIVAGAPGRDLPHARNVGELVAWLVPAAWGAPAGYPETPSVPTAQQPLTYVQGAAGVLGHGERADRFGSVIATDAVDGRYGPATLVVGIPKEDIGRKTNAGAVALLTSTNGVLTGNDLLWQGHGLPGKSRKGDLRCPARTVVWSRPPAGPGTRTAGASRVPPRPETCSARPWG
jgi:hypothetical protein